MTNSVGNIFERSEQVRSEEWIETLISSPHARVERIVSHGHASPAGFWYDQEQPEWVIVLKGAAGLRFEGEAEAVTLEAGDYLNIPAHRRHRVEWTQPDAPTIWLAIHYT